MTTAYEAPQGKTETVLSGIWSELLGVNHVSRRDDFFALGGHSVLALGMLSRVNQVMSADLSLSDLFRQSQLADFAALVDTVDGGVSRPTSIACEVETDAVPLSAAQQRVWFMGQISPDTSAYNLFWALRVRGPLVPALLERAIAEVQARHHVLRSVFRMTEDGLVQQLMSQPDRVVHHLDFSGLDAAQREEHVERLARESANLAFNLEREAPLRVHLLKLSAEEWALFVNMHHIASDGWSQELFFRDLSACYSAFAHGKLPTLEPLRLQYADVVLTEREWMRGKECGAQLEYWKKQLSGRLQPVQVSLDHPRQRTPSHRGAVEVRTLPAELLEALHALGRTEGVTLFVTLLGAFQVLLHRRNGLTDIVVGTDVANRGRANTSGMIGLFVNQLVLRTDLSGSPTFREVLRRARSTTLDALANQQVPFDRLVKELRPERDPASNPLFQVMFIVQTASAASVRLPGMHVEPIVVPIETAPFDLTVAFAETKSGLLRLDCRYRTDLFAAETIRGFADQFSTLLETVVRLPDVRVDDLDVRSAGEVAVEQAEKHRRKAAKQSKLASAKPREIDDSVDSRLSVERFAAQQQLPVLIRPRDGGVDLDELAREHREWIENHLQRDGAIVFRGFAIDTVERLKSFTDALTQGALDYTERSSKRTLIQRGVYTSTDHPQDQPIILHNEQSYTLNWPMKLLFLCLRPADVGGATPLADSRRILARLSEHTVTEFAQRQVLYVRNYGDGFGLPWREVFQTCDPKEVEAHCERAGIEVEWKGGDRLQTRQRRPAIHQHPRTGESVWFNHAFFFNVLSLGGALRSALLTAATPEDDLPFQTLFGDGSSIPDRAIHEIREAIDAETVTFSWRKGDLLLIDNMLVAHGRQPYEGPRAIAVTMAEPYASVVKAAE